MENLALQGLHHRTFQDVASRYIDWAILSASVGRDSPEYLCFETYLFCKTLHVCRKEI
jgi:hypothetical protein